ncbi:MAG: hypothetical protein COA86_10245 [Kangiella sp.]|nr:MAG: hypothetical protein COA86_10245 [Kangiella sp.]
MNKILIIGLILVIASCSDSPEDNENDGNKKEESSAVETNSKSKHYYSMYDLKGMVDQLNSSLPMEYDSVTILNSVSAKEGRIIQYSYKVDMDAMLTGMGKELNMSMASVKSMLNKQGGLEPFFKDYIKNEYGPEIVRDDCSNAPLVKLLNDSVSFHHYFYDLNSKFISKVVVLKEYCK